ncbi:transcription antitermination factor NusB [Thermosipho ferrireducens]|uniref:Transcription antitermination protein NusB n=1 Tax=Thermosipho ferrireducens TaxID=2571116 RepID=A0ABX7S9L6_9BACT|nr:transcription antitermination factor NusB [Thermosipho ferrireducens]QTA38402.1 transcription antitermination factor NusB [Thermosipho ferrireducens]
MATRRRKMREYIFKTLFQWDFRGDDLEEIAKEELLYIRDKKLRIQAFEYVKEMKKVIGEIDKIIGKYLENWSLERLSAVDRNILRLGTYELLYVKDVPIEVTLDEMIELGKTFGTENSGKFVNGVLDKIAKGEAPKEKFEL